jgi:hypothetical protein
VPLPGIVLFCDTLTFRKNELGARLGKEIGIFTYKIARKIFSRLS